MIGMIVSVTLVARIMTMIDADDNVDIGEEGFGVGGYYEYDDV